MVFEFRVVSLSNIVNHLNFKTVNYINYNIIGMWDLLVVVIEGLEGVLLFSLTIQLSSKACYRMHNSYPIEEDHLIDREGGRDENTSTF